MLPGRCETWNEEFQPICCPNETPRDACYFPNNSGDRRCFTVESCGQGETAVDGGPFYLPNGFGCAWAFGDHSNYPSKPLCCNLEALEIVS